MYIYRIRKKLPSGRLAPGVGLRLAKHFGDGDTNVLTSRSKAPPKGSLIVNYGRSQEPSWSYDECVLLNTPAAVARAVDKRETLRILSEAGVPSLVMTTEAYEAAIWAESIQVVARTTAKGKKGNGIILVNNPIYLPAGAELYTQVYEKNTEFRVHVFRGEVIDYVQKKKVGKKRRQREGLQDPDPFIRNHARGWVFCHANIVHSGLVMDIAIEAVRALGLDFAGVDVLAKLGPEGVADAVVCEVNSAPGMSAPTTFRAYCEAIQKAAGGTYD